MRPVYRLRQALLRLLARPAPADLERARALLGPRAYELFCRQSCGDQVHALCVWRAVGDRLDGAHALYEAALLHDVGKAGARITLLHRALYVLLRTLAPQRLGHLGRLDGTSGWRRPLVALCHHAELGARCCEATGCLSETVLLVRYHEGGDPPAGAAELRKWLDVLRYADDHC